MTESEKQAVRLTATRMLAVLGDMTVGVPERVGMAALIEIGFLLVAEIPRTLDPENFEQGKIIYLRLLDKVRQEVVDLKKEDLITPPSSKNEGELKEFEGNVVSGKFVSE